MFIQEIPEELPSMRYIPAKHRVKTSYHSILVVVASTPSTVEVLSRLTYVMHIGLDCLVNGST